MAAGSHLWGMDRIPTVAECVNAEMRIGEALVLLGSVYHCAGSNSTTHEKRMLHGLFFCQGILRTEVGSYFLEKFICCFYIGNWRGCLDSLMRKLT